MDDTSTSNKQNEPIGRKGGMASGSTMERETTGQKVKEGWQDFKTKISQKWNDLTDKDIDNFQRKDRRELVGYVHGRVGGDRTLVERDIDTLARETNYRFD